MHRSQFVRRVLAIKIAPDQIRKFCCHKCLFKSVQLSIRSSLTQFLKFTCLNIWIVGSRPITDRGYSPIVPDHKFHFSPFCPYTDVMIFYIFLRPRLKVGDREIKDLPVAKCDGSETDRAETRVAQSMWKFIRRKKKVQVAINVEVYQKKKKVASWTQNDRQVDSPLQIF